MRQWQHWGSGCYKYQCDAGRLHIMVGNVLLLQRLEPVVDLAKQKDNSNNVFTFVLT